MSTNYQEIIIKSFYSVFERTNYNESDDLYENNRI